MTSAVIGASIGAAGAIGGSMLSKNSNTTTSQGPTNSRETGTIKTSGFSPEIIKLLEGIISGGQYSKSAAIKDSNDAVLGAMQEVMQNFMPSIASTQKGSGMTGDSMTQLLANQTAMQAAVQGGKLKMDSINNYNTDLVNMLNSLASGQGRTETRDLTTKSEPVVSNTSSGMCWITTAICEQLGLPDDCEALRVLRWFRDVHMSNPDFPERNALVTQYYDLAPKYTPVLEAMSESSRIAKYEFLNTEFLQPAVKNIIAGEYTTALSLYTNMVKSVQETVFALAPELAPSDGGV